MKRIAIQYSGEIRNLLDCFNNHYENFILPNTEYEVDIFAHLWIDEKDSDQKIKRITETINPKDICFQKPINFNNLYDQNDKKELWFLNMVSMFYGIQKVNEMRLEYERINQIKYDYIIRTRTDIIFMPNCIEKIDCYDKESIHIKDYVAFEHYGINDYFAIGSPESINKYCSVYSNMNSMINNGCAVIPECLIGFNIKDLKITKHNFKMWPYKYIYMELEKAKGGTLG